MASIQDSRTRVKTLDVAAKLESGRSAAEMTSSSLGESQKQKMKNFTKEGWMWKYTKKKKNKKYFRMVGSVLSWSAKPTVCAISGVGSSRSARILCRYEASLWSGLT